MAKSQDRANAIVGVFDKYNLKQNIITGGASSLVTDTLTSNKALRSDSVGKVWTSNIASTELGYLSGVNSNIQTQLKNKLSSSSRVGSCVDLITSSQLSKLIAGNTMTISKIINPGQFDDNQIKFDVNLDLSDF